MSAGSTESGSSSRSASANDDRSATPAPARELGRGPLVLGHELHDAAGGRSAAQEVGLDLPDPAADLDDGPRRRARPPRAHAAICRASEPPSPSSR